MRFFKVALVMLTLLMFTMAVLPLFGLDLVLFGQAKLAKADVDASNMHLFMVRSAAFATFSSFAILYPGSIQLMSSVTIVVCGPSMTPAFFCL